MEKKHDSKANIVKMVAVLLGVFGAGWLFSSVWRTVVTSIENYTFETNFFSYFFGVGLYSLATLAISVLFFIVSLRDLEPLKKVFSLVCAILSAVAFIAYIVSMLRSIENFTYLATPKGLVDISALLMLITYFLFAMYQRNGGTIKNVAWVVGMIGIIVLLIGALYGYVAAAFEAKITLDYVFTSLAHVCVFYCGLREF